MLFFCPRSEGGGFKYTVFLGWGEGYSILAMQTIRLCVVEDDVHQSARMEVVLPFFLS